MNKMVVVHITCALLSYVGFLIAFISGILFLVQEHQLKRKKMGWWFHRLPSLEVIERINYLAIGIGFALLSVGFAFGIIGAKQVFGHWWTGDPKEYLTALVWVSYLSLWLVRLRSTLRGRRVALLSILGFSLVLFTFLGVNNLLTTWHTAV